MSPVIIFFNLKNYIEQVIDPLVLLSVEVECLESIMVGLQEHVGICSCMRKIPVSHGPFLTPVQIVCLQIIHHIWIKKTIHFLEFFHI